MRNSNMDFKNFIAIAAVTALAAAAGSVGAQTQSTTTPGAASPEVSTPATSPTTPAPDMATQPSEEYTKLDKDKDKDKDKDGSLSKKEARKKKQLSMNWSTLDANKDDKLDPAEFAQFEAMPKEPEGDKSQSAPRSAPPVM